MDQLGETLKEASALAAHINSSDDTGVYITLRSYGFLVQVQHEVGDIVKKDAKQVTWEQLNPLSSVSPNPLIAAIEDLRNSTL